LDEDEEDLIIKMDNIHKTYLLGIEGVPALRYIELLNSNLLDPEYLVFFP